MYEVDLHLHTYYSDGVYSPEEVAEMAHRQGVKKLSITDHDGVWGLYEGRIAAKKYGIEFVNGIELSIEHQGRVEIHILGHGFDEACPEILKAGEEAMTARRSRNERLVQALGEEGYDITIDELYRGSKTGYVGKPHIAKLLKQLRILGPARSRPSCCRPPTPISTTPSRWPAAPRGSGRRSRWPSAPRSCSACASWSWTTPTRWPG